MDRAVELLWSYAGDDRATTAIEYGLIAGIISIASVLVLMQIGFNLQAIFNKTAGML